MAQYNLVIGTGFVFAFEKNNQCRFRLRISVGYCFEPQFSRMFYRFQYTPMVSIINESGFRHWGGASIGNKI